MSDFFNIWSPFRLSPSLVGFDVTPRDAALLHKGTATLVAGCLQACGISAEPADWSIRCVRQNFYSDYLDSEDWRARWDIGWVLEVNLGSEIEKQNIFQPIPFKTDAQDQTYGGEDEPDFQLGPALIISTFPNDEDVERSVIKAIQSWQSEAKPRRDVAMQSRRFNNGYLQVRALAEETNFPADIASLDSLQASLKELGGRTNWRGLFADFRDEQETT